MRQWARQAIYYHIVIDRFATGARQFCFPASCDYDARLGDWMGGTLRGIAASLDYLHELGTDALILTPFFKGKKYHGYWVTDFFAVDPRFGTVDDLRKLIHAAHRQGIRVIMDLPITHCHRDSALAVAACTRGSSTADWLCRDPARNIVGFFGDSRLPELNLDHEDVVRYVKRVIDHWLALGLDGIRFDHAKRPPTRFWRALSAHLGEKHPEVLLLGENWVETGEVGALSPYLHGELNISLAAALRQFARMPTDASLQRILQRVMNQRSLRQSGYVLPVFLDNHDMERVSCVAQGQHRNIALAYFAMFTLPYPAMIYYGSETAQEQSANLPPRRYERDRYFREPMEWGKVNALIDFITQLIKLRRRFNRWFRSEPQRVACSAQGVTAYRYLHADTALTVMFRFQARSKPLFLACEHTEVILSLQDRDADCTAVVLKHSARVDPLQTFSPAVRAARPL